MRGLAAAKIEDHAGANLGAGDDEFIVDAALETVARIRLDVELAARGGSARPIGRRGDVPRWGTRKRRR